MNRSIRIARELVRLAKMIAASGNDIASREEFEEYAKQIGLEKNIILSNDEYDLYTAHFDPDKGEFSFQLYVKDDGVYYAKAVITPDELKKGDTAEAYGDNPIEYGAFPIDKNTFKSWMDMNIREGVRQGQSVIRNYRGWLDNAAGGDDKDYYSLD